MLINRFDIKLLDDKLDFPNLILKNIINFY